MNWTSAQVSWPLAAAFVSVCLWASAFVGIRAAGTAFSPGALALGRLTLGSLVLGALVVARGTVRPTLRETGLLVIAGLTWFGMYNVTLNAAERILDAGTAAMLIMIAPMLVVLLAGVFLKERFTRGLLLGGLGAFAGVVLIGFSTASRQAPLSGVVLCLVAAIASAIGVVAQKPVLRRLSALQVTWTCCAIGALCCLPAAPTLIRELGVAPQSAIAWLIFLGVFPTAVAFTTWAYALARGTAGRIAATAYLVPPVAILISWLVLDEVPGAIAVGGGLLCFLGVYVARRAPNPRSNP